MSIDNQPHPDTQLLNSIRTALHKACELGYDVERMEVTASMGDGVCSVHFAPLVPAGFIQAGGDLSLTIDTVREQVVECRRGQ